MFTLQSCIASSVQTPSSNLAVNGSAVSCSKHSINMYRLAQFLLTYIIIFLCRQIIFLSRTLLCVLTFITSIASTNLKASSHFCDSVFTAWGLEPLGAFPFLRVLNLVALCHILSSRSESSRTVPYPKLTFSI
jgi:hypothetical protein